MLHVMALQARICGLQPPPLRRGRPRGGRPSPVSGARPHPHPRGRFGDQCRDRPAVHGRDVQPPGYPRHRPLRGREPLLRCRGDREQFLRRPPRLHHRQRELREPGRDPLRPVRGSPANSSASTPDTHHQPRQHKAASLPSERPVPPMSKRARKKKARRKKKANHGGKANQDGTTGRDGTPSPREPTRWPAPTTCCSAANQPPWPRSRLPPSPPTTSRHRPASSPCWAARSTDSCRGGAWGTSTAFPCCRRVRFAG
ncbi:hypothetical protein SAMN05216268_116184 [Streptomyces yunnanensis]|uniref:Uncharacterized protein n=1 Tax=Streptomyces yunnanensis TaxID=156453 RepID=A0A9X8N4L8_9ACTN|nr:hypothetical protein SAMN05216268_116184 [Streptomyces yunnanensis]